MRKWMFLAAFLVATLSAPAQNAENGKRLFLKNGCYECHGTVGQGAQTNPLAPRLASRPPALAAFIVYVRKPSSNMPPYVSKVMPDSELADVRAYLATVPEPPPLNSISLLNP